MAKRGPNARRLALQICTGVLLRGESLSRQLEQRLASLEDKRERAFCSELCFGFCRYFHVLDATLRRLLTRPLKNRDRDVSVVLLLGMLQIRFLRVGDHAAVNESVALLRTIRKEWAKGLVNGVLRNYQRELHSNPATTTAKLENSEQALAYPAWIRDRINLDWGDRAPVILAAGNEHAPMALRVDNARISRDDYRQRLHEQGLEARMHPLVETALVLEQPCGVDALPGFDQGLVSVQDGATQLAAKLLDCRPGMRVLDACAAPGGKTLHLMQNSENLDVTALDKDDRRLRRVAENLARANLAAQLLAADAAHVGDWFDGRAFDRILLDAPCSASGIIRRHPDIRLLRRPEDIDSLATQQDRLLRALWPLLAPGGLLLYCTCSVFRQENEQRIEDFLHHNADCVEVPLDDFEWGVKRPFGRQILPGFNDMDGFFYALLRKHA